MTGMPVSYVVTIHICHWIWGLFTKTIPINIVFFMDTMCCSQEKWLFKTFRAEDIGSLWYYQITKHWSHPTAFHCPFLTPLQITKFCKAMCTWTQVYIYNEKFQRIQKFLLLCCQCCHTEFCVYYVFHNTLLSPNTPLNMAAKWGSIRDCNINALVPVVGEYNVAFRWCYILIYSVSTGQPNPFLHFKMMISSVFFSCVLFNVHRNYKHGRKFKTILTFSHFSKLWGLFHLSPLILSTLNTMSAPC